MTEQEKIKELTPLYQQQNDLIQKQIDLVNTVANDDTRTALERAKANLES